MSLRHMQTHHPCLFEDRIEIVALPVIPPLAQHIIMHKAIEWGTFEVIPAGRHGDPTSPRKFRLAAPLRRVVWGCVSL